MAFEIEVGKKAKRGGENAKRFSIRTENEQYKAREGRVLFEGGLLIAALLIGLLVRWLAYEGTLVTSGSMEPLLKRGDYALADHRAALRGTWKRGDVVLFVSPEDWSSRGETLVKRVVGLPGETVQIRDGVVFINGKKLDETYLAAGVDLELTPTWSLRPNEYFVLGDNRNFSDDSRENGPITERDIRGKLVFQLWPPGKIGSL